MPRDDVPESAAAGTYRCLQWSSPGELTPSCLERISGARGTLSLLHTAVVI